MPPTTSQTFANDAANGTGTFNGDGKTTTASAKLSTVTVSYNAVTNSYSISTAGRSQSFGPADPQQSDSNRVGDVYSKESAGVADSLFLTKPGTSGAFNLRYVGGGIWQRTAADSLSGSVEAFAYGFATPVSAVPRSGTGAFSINLLAVEAPNAGTPYAIRGAGSLNVDFGAGSLNLTGNLIAGLSRPDNSLTPAGTFSGTGTLSSASNGFSGNLTISETEAYAGTMAGRFYGPAAEEVGAAIALNGSRGGAITGVIVGRQGSGEIDERALAGLSSTTSFSLNGEAIQYDKRTSDGRLTIGFPSGSSFSGLDINPASTSFTLGGAGVTQTFGSGDRVSAESNNRYQTYAKAVGPTDSKLRLFQPGVGNDQIALTYTSFVDLQQVTHNGSSDTILRLFNVYGFVTQPSQLPRTGSATYAGIVVGSGVESADNVDLPTSAFSVGGTANFAADFASLSVGLTLSLTGTPLAGGSATNLGTYTSNSRIIPDDSSFFSNQFSAPSGLVQAASVYGHFYGPAASEIGANFAFRNVVDSSTGRAIVIEGVAIGKR